ncbi:hypothetical protein Tco_0020453 [Tanacetum coccineum]
MIGAGFFHGKDMKQSKEGDATRIIFMSNRSLVAYKPTADVTTHGFAEVAEVVNLRDDQSNLIDFGNGSTASD